jgi:competence ComEA-like helix-hairpin-helix protein
MAYRKLTAIRVAGIAGVSGRFQFTTKFVGDVRWAGHPARRWLAAALLLAFGAAFLPAAVATTKKPPPRPININSANSTELQQVPGIGPATADKILEMRKSYGAFKSVDDLLAIRGIGKKRLDKMRKYLIAGQPPAVKPVTKPAAARSRDAKDSPSSSKTPSPSAKSAAKPATSADKSGANANASTETDSDEEPE